MHPRKHVQLQPRWRVDKEHGGFHMAYGRDRSPQEDRGRFYRLRGAGRVGRRRRSRTRRRRAPASLRCPSSARAREQDERTRDHRKRGDDHLLGSCSGYARPVAAVGDECRTAWPLESDGRQTRRPSISSPNGREVRRAIVRARGPGGSSVAEPSPRAQRVPDRVGGDAVAERARVHDVHPDVAEVVGRRTVQKVHREQTDSRAARPPPAWSSRCG